MMPEKVHFLIIRHPPSRSERLATDLLCCYVISLHMVGRVALTERLLTQVLGPRNERYQYTYNKSWIFLPAKATMRIPTLRIQLHI